MCDATDLGSIQPIYQDERQDQICYRDA